MKQWMICSLSAALLVGLMPVNAQEKKPDDKPKAPAEAPARAAGAGAVVVALVAVVAARASTGSR